MPVRDTKSEAIASTTAKHLRANGVSICDVADFLEISDPEAADFISGRVPWPMGLLYTLATHVGLSPEEIFGE